MVLRLLFLLCNVSFKQNQSEIITMALDLLWILTLQGVILFFILLVQFFFFQQSGSSFSIYLTLFFICFFDNYLKNTMYGVYWKSSSRRVVFLYCILVEIKNSHLLSLKCIWSIQTSIVFIAINNRIYGGVLLRLFGFGPYSKSRHKCVNSIEWITIFPLHSSNE